MSVPKVSLFASSVRPQLYPALLNSLDGTIVECEIVMAGHCTYEELKKEFPNVNIFRLRGGTQGNSYEFLTISGYNFKYIHTNRIKPAQCYEISRRHCTGEVVVWIADDCELPNNVIGKAYDYWKSQNNEKLILSIQTKESGYNNPKGSLFPMNQHRFFSWDPNSPLMAPLGMMSRKFLDEMGGLDRRYVCGQYENDVVMRAYQHGATVEIFGGPDCYIDIDHLGKSIAIGESTNEKDFLNRPFSKGYRLDREILEKSWTFFDERELFNKLQRGEHPVAILTMSKTQLDKFEPYEDKDILMKSQSTNIKEMWQ